MQLKNNYALKNDLTKPKAISKACLIHGAPTLKQISMPHSLPDIILFIAEQRPIELPLTQIMNYQ